MRFFFLSLLLLFIFSKTLPQSVNEVVKSTVNQVSKYKSISYTSNQKWGNVGDITDFTPLKGRCKFMIVPTDTIIGAFYSFEDEKIIDKYNGASLVRVTLNEKLISVIDLKKNPAEKRNIKSKMLYSFSIIDILNLLKSPKGKLYKVYLFYRIPLSKERYAKGYWLQNQTL